jgi:hypothetical protein
MAGYRNKAGGKVPEVSPTSITRSMHCNAPPARAHVAFHALFLSLSSLTRHRSPLPPPSHGAQFLINGKRLTAEEMAEEAARAVREAEEAAAAAEAAAREAELAEKEAIALERAAAQAAR